jgi:hypothetical protein
MAELWNYALATMKKRINTQVQKHQHDKLKDIKEAYLLTWKEFIGEFCLEILLAITLREYNLVQYETYDEPLGLVFDKYFAQAQQRIKFKRARVCNKNIERDVSYS